MEHPVYALARIEATQQQIIHMLRELKPPPTPPPLPIGDWLKLVLAVVLVWSALTGQLTPADLVKFWP